MSRPRQFDRNTALGQALALFELKGFAKTTTDDLRLAMGIGRQSFYNTFGDKWEIYKEALQSYQQEWELTHLQRLRCAESPIDGLVSLLLTGIPENSKSPIPGFININSIAEFGTSRSDLSAIQSRGSELLMTCLIQKIDQGKDKGQFDSNLNARDAARYVAVSLMAIELAARAGTSREDLKNLARFLIDRLKAS